MSERPNKEPRAFIEYNPQRAIPSIFSPGHALANFSSAALIEAESIARVKNATDIAIAQARASAGMDKGAQALIEYGVKHKAEAEAAQRFMADRCDEADGFKPEPVPIIVRPPKTVKSSGAGEIAEPHALDPDHSKFKPDNSAMLPVLHGALYSRPPERHPRGYRVSPGFCDTCGASPGHCDCPH